MKPFVAILPCLLLLAACGSDPAADQGAGGQGSAAGEVLEGSISDDMLPLDTIRSQAPSLEKTPAAPGTDDAAAGDENGDKEDGAGAEAAASPSPETPAENE